MTPEQEKVYIQCKLRNLKRALNRCSDDDKAEELKSEIETLENPVQ